MNIGARNEKSNLVFIVISKCTGWAMVFQSKSHFPDDRLGQAISPFLLLDYAAPYQFDPTTARHGVGSHPHRGFETVTIAYSGEVTHKDSSGGGAQFKQAMCNG